MRHVTLWTVLKLRTQLWWMFLFDTTSNHRLKIRWSKRFTSPDGHGFQGYWAWICVVRMPVIETQTGYALGPVRQWTLQEALSLAARKAEWVLHPEREPVKIPEPNPLKPKHMKMYRLLDQGLVGIECWCGWIAPVQKCHPERDSASRCYSCAVAEGHYDQHEADANRKTIEETVTK